MVRSISSSLSVCLLGILFIYLCVCVSVYVHVGSCVSVCKYSVCYCKYIVYVGSCVCLSICTVYMLIHTSIIQVCVYQSSVLSAITNNL